SWIDYCKTLIDTYHIDKVVSIVSGGNTGQESIYNGLKKANELYSEDSIVLIHDGVRPLIDRNTISNAIICVKENGSAITVSPAIETVVIKQTEDKVEQILNRKSCHHAKAPQCFILKDIFEAHNKAKKEQKNDFIDSAFLMQYYGYELHTIEGTSENIKITTPSDFYMFRAIVEAREISENFNI
ncbi:MAG: 2-C-methyl-D-erythritol 4-phosphate cytidylyltransferase, partial [Lachnospiraceae bacterium]|nr:2-C-methyl-D-erythritol 4-phosphate cytidylyltransferase [Lachnospiraceae bacterium]